MKKIYFLLLVSLFVKSSFAQNSESLDLEKAIQLGLENNLDVKIAVENINLRQGEERIGLGSFLAHENDIS